MSFRYSYCDAALHVMYTICSGRYEVHIVVHVEISVHWDVTVCNLVGAYQCFGKMCLHLVAEGSVFHISAEDRYSTFSGNRRPHTQKTFMLIYQTTDTWFHIPEDHNLVAHHCWEPQIRQLEILISNACVFHEELCYSVMNKLNVYIC